MKAYVEIRKSREKSSIYPCVVVDLGYRIAVMSFDRVLCCELTGLTIAEIYGLQEGSKIPIIFDSSGDVK